MAGSQIYAKSGDRKMKFKNIVLIGAAGCGKTTIGQLLAKKLQLAFFDVDECIEKKEGKSIKDIFVDGEECFRRIESEVLCEIINNMHNKVISTGGGVVKLKKNMEMFDENSVIIFINRPVEQIAADIDISTRPLLSDDRTKVYELYNERYPLYKRYCNYEILNNKCIEDVLNQIMQILG